MSKTCPKCKEEKEREAFYASPSRSDGLSQCCIPCELRRKKETYQSDPEKARTRKREWAAKNTKSVAATGLRKRMAITEEEIQKVLSTDTVCEICSVDACKSYGRMSADHDHKTGRFRGALCSECNTGLGKFRDNPELLREAADYLERKKGTKACL